MSTRSGTLLASALLLALAFVHAGWNLLLSGQRGHAQRTAVALLTGALVFAPVAALTWRLDSSAWPYIAASSSLELAVPRSARDRLRGGCDGLRLSDRARLRPRDRAARRRALRSPPAVPRRLRRSASSLVAVGIVLVRGLRTEYRPARSRAHGARYLRVHCRLHARRQARHHHGNPLAYLQVVVHHRRAVAYFAGALRGGAARAAIRAGSQPVSMLAAGVGFFGPTRSTLAALRLAPAAARRAPSASRASSSPPRRS